MPASRASSPECIDWGVASKAMLGETRAADLHVVKPLPGGVLLAAVDGLGHGREAVAAARIAADVLESHAEEPLGALVRRSHQALMPTRGAVMTLATLRSRERRLTWLGVGNVEAVVLTGARGGSDVARERALLLRNGVVGYQLPALRTGAMPVAPGDLLILATDGIQAGFAESVVCSDPPQRIASRILRRHFKGTDDALVLVARYIGTSDESPSA